jgi:Flp pilus assembly pilin Flp
VGTGRDSQKAKCHLPNLHGDLVTIVRGNYMIKRMVVLYVRLRETTHEMRRGQTMTEYALILAAVAMIVFVSYETMGQSISAMVEWGTIHNDLITTF